MNLISLDRGRLAIRSCDGWGICVCYDDVPLWRAFTLDLTELTFSVAHDGLGSFNLQCIDQYGERFIYGEWSTIEEVIRWLKNPIPVN